MITTLSTSARRLFSLFLIMLSCGYCFSQNDTSIYYLDQNLGLCAKEKAVYVAKGFNEKEKFKLSHFVLSTGKLFRETMFTDFLMDVKDGPYTEYDEQGQLLAKGSYADNKEDGYWLHWRHGQLTDSILFEKGVSILSISYSYNQDGILITRMLKDSKTNKFELTSFDENGNLTRQTKWINGTGDQSYYYPTGHVKSIETYKNKKLVSTTHFKPDGAKISEKEMKKTMEQLSAAYKKQVTGAPSYPGGSAGFNSFFRRNFKAPPSLGREGFSETVTVTFYLDKSGFASKIQVSGASNREIETEVLTVFRRMVAWNMNGHTSFGPITYTINLSPN